MDPFFCEISLNFLRGREAREMRKNNASGGYRRRRKGSFMRDNDRAQFTTGLDLREGLAFSVILILWMVSIWALSIVGGPNG